MLFKTQQLAYKLSKRIFITSVERIFSIYSVEQIFSILDKLLTKDRHFSSYNVCKYLVLYVNKSLE